MWTTSISFGQQKDITIEEETTESSITLYAQNHTDATIEMDFTANIVGFQTNENPFQKVTLQPKQKLFLIKMNAVAGVPCEYNTSVSYKKLRKETTTTEIAGNENSRTTSIQMNPTKINVFTQNGCGRCSLVIDYLEKNKIPYTELNTTAHSPNQDLMFDVLAKAGFKGTTVQMPVVVQHGKTHYDIKDLKTFVGSLK